MREMPQYQETPIGLYHLSKLVGVGPVSRIYLAERRDWPGRQIALKLFEAVPLISMEEKDQALDEVRMLICLEHPSILPLLDDGLHETMLYLVTPYIEAGSLRQRLTAAAGELLPLKETMALLRQVGEALQFAHLQQIVHANLKPENILFQIDGKVLLADFLLPSLVRSERTARILSTFAALYMAPEQFQGVATPLSDQYALACLAYELLAGRPPFEADDFMSLARKHANEQPRPPSELQPKRAQHIDHVLLKALVKRPEGRYPDVQTFLTELSAPPPLAILASTQEMDLPRVWEELPVPVLAVPAGVAQEAEVLPPQEEFPAGAICLAAQASPRETFPTVASSPPEALLLQPQEAFSTAATPGLYEAVTMSTVSTIPGHTTGNGGQGDRLPGASRQPRLRARRLPTSRLSRRQTWLTVGLVILAMLLSLSGIVVFFSVSSANHAQSQARGGSTTPRASTSTTGQLSSTATPGVTPSPTTSAHPSPTPKPTTRPKPTAKPTVPKATPTAAPATGISCSLSYKQTSLWSNGFVARLSIANTGTVSIQGWTLAFALPSGQQIVDGWNGHFTQNGAQVTISNENFNATIDPGSSVSVGFETVTDGNNGTPTSFSLNGVTCH